MTIVIILTIIFILLGIASLVGKGSFLIAGYNTASKKEKEKYDEKKLNRCMAIFYFINAVALGATAYVDTDKFATYFLVPIVFLSIIFVFIVANTYCKRK